MRLPSVVGTQRFCTSPHADVPVDVAVDVGNFREGAVRGIHLVILRGRRDRAQFGHEAPAGHREGLDVVVAAGDDLHPAVGEVQAAELVRGLDRRREPERVVVLPIPRSARCSRIPGVRSSSSPVRQS